MRSGTLSSRTPATASGPPTYSVKELAERYAVTEQTVLGWIHAGELRALNVGRHLGAKKPRWRITREALEAFEVLRTPAQPAPKARRHKRAADVIQFYS